MKGVLVGVDFVTQTDGTLKLLEINTSVQFGSDFEYFDTQAVVDLATELSFDSVTIIDKPTVNSHEVYAPLSASLAAAGKSLLFEDVDKNAVTSPDIDHSTTLAIRVSYDVNAIVDYTYARDNHNIVELFNAYGSGSNIVNTYFSSSVGLYDNLTTETNTISGSTLPNIIVKKRFPDIYKNDFPHYFNVSSTEELDVIREEYKGDFIVNNYTVDANNIIDNKLGTQIRKWYLIYGSPLTAKALGGYRFTNQAPLNLPLELVDGTNRFEGHNKKELTSNAATLYYYGVPGDSMIDKIVSGSDTNVPATEVNIGDTVKTIKIPGLDITNDTDYVVEGLGYPEGTFYSSSVVMGKVVNEVADHLLKVDISGSDINSFTISPDEKIFAYSVADDQTKFIQGSKLTAGDKIMVNLDSNVTVTGLSYQWFDDTFVTLDVEDIDAFVGGPSINMNLFIHNAPCFVAGTLIKLKDGVKPIEEVEVGEEVLSYNHRKLQEETGKVVSILSKKDVEVVTYTLSNETSITATLDHPIFVEDKGYSSLDPDLTLSDSNLKVAKIEVGDVLKSSSGESITISAIEVQKENTTVYNLNAVEPNSNYYANGVLVHNRKSR